MKRVVKLGWDERFRVEVKLTGTAVFHDFIVVERLNISNGETVTSELSAPLTYGITGVRRCSDRHLLIGTRNSVVCFDIEHMVEVCRARQTDGGTPLEDDAVEEECLPSGGFDFDPVRRLLYMLNGYFDEAALSCYELDADDHNFRRVFRREVCGYCPRGLSDQLAAGGICVLPESGHVAAVFTLENLWVPLEAGQEYKGPARLCWVAKFSEKQDVWIEVLRPFDEDFTGDIDPISIGQKRGVQFASAEEWNPQPVAIDDHRIAFATKTGRILVTDLVRGSTDCVYESQGEVTELRFHPLDRLLSVETTQGVRKLTVEEIGPSAGFEQFSVTRVARKPHKPKRYRPKTLPTPATHVLSWEGDQPVAITPDGQFAVAGRYVINLAEMRTVSVISWFGEPIRQVAITHDGSHVLVNDGTVRVFDGTTGTLVHTLSSARQFSVSPSEGFVALADFEELTVWDLQTGKQVHRHTPGGSYVSWSPDSKLIAYGGWQGEVKRKPDGPGLMSVNDDSVNIMDADTGAIVGSWKPGRLKAICWTRHGLLIGTDGKVENWDPLRVAKNGEFSIAGGTWNLSPEHNFLVATSNHGWSKRSNHVAASIYRLPDGQMTAEIVQSLSGFTHVSVGQANESLLINSDRLRLYRQNDGSWIADCGPKWEKGTVTHLSPASPRLATRSWEFLEGEDPRGAENDKPIVIQERIRVWNLSEPSACVFETEFNRPLTSSERVVVISGNGERIAVPTQDAVIVWKVGDQPPLASIEFSGGPRNVLQLSHSGERLAVAVGNKIHLYTLDASEELIRLVSHSQPVTAISFAEDSAWLISGSADQVVKLWDLGQQGSEPRTYLGGERGICALGYLPGLDCVLVSSEDKVIRVWSAASGQLLHTLDGPSNQVCRQILPLDSHRIAAKYGNQVWIWDIAKAKPELRLNTICDWIGKYQGNQVMTSSNGEYQCWPLKFRKS